MAVPFVSPTKDTHARTHTRARARARAREREREREEKEKSFEHVLLFSASQELRIGTIAPVL